MSFMKTIYKDAAGVFHAEYLIFVYTFFIPALKSCEKCVFTRRKYNSCLLLYNIDRNFFFFYKFSKFTLTTFLIIRAYSTISFTL